MNNAFSIVYAKPGDPDLGDLIEWRSTAALPIAGRYRVIDILLSNIVHSGIRSVGIITQRNYNSLMDHLGAGKEWGLSKKSGGLTILPPYDLGLGSVLYKGFVDALLSKRDFIEHQKRPYCLLVATDQIYRQDYDALMDAHISSGADVTLMYSDDPNLMSDTSGATTFLRIVDGRVLGISSQPMGGKDCFANLRSCIMAKDLLMRIVEDTCAEGLYDFDSDMLKNIIPRLKVMGVKHEGYVARVNSVDSYFKLNQDMLKKRVRNDLFDPDFPVYTKTMDSPPTLFDAGCDISGSLFGSGCHIQGRVKNSVIFRGVQIARNADVENCIIMQNSKVASGAKLRNMIVDKEAVIGAGARCISAPYDPGIIRKREIVEGDLL